MTTRHLNDQSWYALPDGTPVLAHQSDLGGYVLYTEAELESLAPADFEVRPDGVVTFQGEATGWTAADLRKMGS